MAWTSADVAKLKKAIASGATEVRYADRTVRYRTLQEMRETLAMIEAEASGRTRTRMIRVGYRSGFE